MNAQQEIKDAQANWAREKKNPIPLYVPTVKSNLFRGRLSARAYHGYESGDGHELDGNMKALHSSSALVVNFFDYWTCRPDKSLLVQALDTRGGTVTLMEFEKKLDTEVSKNNHNARPPNLDVAITLDNGKVVAVESKFTAWTSRSTKEKAHFSEKYFPTVELWQDLGLKKCQALAQELHENRGGKSLFEYLNAAQLLKHVLGLATQRGNPEFSPCYNDFSLYYLYYDWPGEESDAHKEEIKRFADRVGEELRFKALTYQKVYKRLRASEQAEPEYLDYLGNRYFSGRGQG